ncbi:hypothetical protein BJY01DRAFT_226242 [Aspergillus pseudoustus]|uniref:Uncharacterized protein n=1 Tax=Aspergillus pseudoustus TaxID=1810923 RepID=A0ABR4IW25_9EURO
MSLTNLFSISAAAFMVSVRVLATCAGVDARQIGGKWHDLPATIVILISFTLSVEPPARQLDGEIRWKYLSANTVSGR